LNLKKIGKKFCLKLLKIVSRFETKETNYELNQELLNYINSNTYQKIAIYSSNTKKCVDDIVKKHFRKKPDIISKNNCIEPKPTDKDILSILEQWKFKNKNVLIHPTAEISPQAEIKEGTKIWHNSQIKKGARIGKNCIIGRNVYIDSGVIIGNNTRVQSNVNIWKGVTIEDGVFVGPDVCFTNDKFPRAITPKGDPISSHDWIILKTLVKRGSSLGANSTLLPGITINEFAFIGAGSVVTKDVPPYTLYYGNPARLRGYVCKCGKRLTDKCAVCGVSIDDIKKIIEKNK
jgi:UDP-2-acetamido-3-amino-2,3-dideoxy-glucuronate N-acetyltransferase